MDDGDEKLANAPPDVWLKLGVPMHSAETRVTAGCRRQPCTMQPRGFEYGKMMFREKILGKRQNCIFRAKYM